MPILTGIDLLGIQQYVYSSNRLRDILAASWLADHVTSRSSIARWGRAKDDVLLAAGGNAIVEFEALAEARRWTAWYTRWVQDTAPGLEAAVAHREYDNGRLAWALKALAVDLARAKSARRPSVPQLGLSVAATCSITGLPATAHDQVDGGSLLSPAVQELRAHVRDAREQWRNYVPAALAQARGWKAEFPLDLDLMGRTSGDTSLIGIVHVDGNGVGQAITKWLDRCLSEELGDKEVRRQYRDWSGDLDSLGEAIMHAVVKRTADCIVEESSAGHGRGASHCALRGTPHDLGFRLHEGSDDGMRATVQHNQTVFLPLRPVVLGGDDLTFVCDGRIALDLAATAVKQFGDGTIRHLGTDGRERRITACAGVALVRARMPFYRGYQLADDLCQAAKRARREAMNKKNDVETGGWLEWHVGAVRPGETVEEVRRRQYRAGTRVLTMRPYPLAELDDRKQSWRWLDENLLGPTTTNDADGTFRGSRRERDVGGQSVFVPNVWSGSRRRVNLLGTLLASGPEEVARQLTAWNALGEPISLPGALPKRGFVGRSTPLRDAVELLDLHIRLERDPRATDGAAASHHPVTAPKDPPRGVGQKADSR